MSATVNVPNHLERMISIGVRPYRAKRDLKLIDNWDGVSELGQGMMYQQFRLIGSTPPDALRLEMIYWAIQDRICPPTPYEVGLMNYVEGKSKLKYNQINLLS